MIDVSNEIYTRVKTAVQSVCDSTSQLFQDPPASFPHLLVDMKDNPVTVTDMENQECGVTPVVELTAYTKGDLVTAKEIISLADTQMRNMEFTRIFGPQQVTDAEDMSITRIVARYSRLIMAGEEL